MSRPRSAAGVVSGSGSGRSNGGFQKSSRSANSVERLRFLLDGLTHAGQLAILNQIKLEQSSAPPSSLHPSQTSAPSALSSTSSLLRSQARLRPGYVEWEDGCEQVLGYVREGGAEAAQRVFGLLSERMRVKNSESRLLCLYLLDALFQRSARFRHLTLQWLHPLFELALGVTTATSAAAPTVAPLPAPPAAAQQLKEECVTVVRRWQRKWGGVHRVLELGWKWMMDALGIEDDESARRREEAEHKQRSAKEAEVMRLRYDTARQEWNERKNEMQECINSVDGCIEMLFPPEEEWTAPGAETAPKTGLSTSEGVVIDSAAEGAQSASDTEGSTVEWEEDDTEQVEPASDALQPADTTVDGSTGRPPDQEDDWEDEYLRTGGGTEVSGSGDASFAVGDEAEDGEGGEWDVDRLVADAGLGSRAYELDIDFDANLGQLETEDNRPIFQTLRDCCKLMQKTYLPLLTEWRYVAKRVRLQPPAAAATALSDDARQTHALLQRREQQEVSDALGAMLDLMTRKLQQCAQLNITTQQRPTLLTQMDEAQAQRTSSAAQSAAQQQQGAGGGESKPGQFFGVLKRARQQAVKRVDKHARKRRVVKDKWMAKPSDQHKKVKLGTQS